MFFNAFKKAAKLVANELSSQPIDVKTSRKKNSKHGQGKSSTPCPDPSFLAPEVSHADSSSSLPEEASLPTKIPLPLPTPVPPTRREPWHVIKAGFGHQHAHLVSTTDHQPAMRIDYVAGAVGSASGFGFYASPDAAFPADDVALSYRVYFPPNYDWRRGGKLPGLFIGAPGASGGNWDRDCGSVRVVWKEQGGAAAYLYVPCQVAACGTKDGVVAAQCPEYAEIANVTAKKGHHVWKKGGARFKAGEWNVVTLRVRLNDPGEKNGILEMEINGVRLSFDKMYFRTDPSLRLEGVNFVTFFGGNQKAAAAPPSAFTVFKDIVLHAPRR
jgi:hypothetical protein